MSEETLEEIKYYSEMYPDGIHKKLEAKEMFEELGMEREEVVGKISYHFKDDMDYPYGMYAYVDFDLLKREYHTNMVNCDEEIQQAINKQVEELGWNK